MKERPPGLCDPATAKGGDLRLRATQRTPYVCLKPQDYTLGVLEASERERIAMLWRRPKDITLTTRLLRP